MTRKDVMNNLMANYEKYGIRDYNEESCRRRKASEGGGKSSRRDIPPGR